MAIKKHCFYQIFYLCSSIVDNVFDCRLSGVRLQEKNFLTCFKYASNSATADSNKAIIDIYEPEPSLLKNRWHVRYIADRFFRENCMCRSKEKYRTCTLEQDCVLKPGTRAGEHQYSKICVKRPLKNRQNKDLNDKW